jgi:hypothetical protein
LRPPREVSEGTAEFLSWSLLGKCQEVTSLQSAPRCGAPSRLRSHSKTQPNKTPAVANFSPQRGAFR